VEAAVVAAGKANMAGTGTVAVAQVAVVPNVW
jgi:hypothetical protein